MTIINLSIVVLALLFLGTLVPRFSLTLAALPAAYLVARAAGVSDDDLLGFFPADFFVLVVGVTAFFAVIQESGTLDWLFQQMLRLLRGRLVLVPVVVFAIGAVLSGVGTLPAAATAIMAPLTMGLARKYALSPLLMALTALGGIIAGLFSPISVFGVTALQMYDRLGVDTPDSTPVVFALCGLTVGVVLQLAYLVVWRRDLLGGSIVIDSPELVTVGAGAGERRGGTGKGGTVATRESGRSASVATGGPAPESAAGGSAAGEPESATTRALCIAALVALVVVAVGLDANIGFVALTLTFVLQLVIGLDANKIVARIPWSVVLLIGGILTYIGVMQEIGAFAQLGRWLTIDGSPLLTLLALAYVAGVTSFFASSIAVFATVLPLVPPVVAAGVDPVSALVVVALSSVLVDVNPFGITGGLILGSTAPESRDRLFRQMLAYGVVSTLVAPFAVWALCSWW